MARVAFATAACDPASQDSAENPWFSTSAPTFGKRLCCPPVHGEVQLLRWNAVDECVERLALEMRDADGLGAFTWENPDLSPIKRAAHHSTQEEESSMSRTTSFAEKAPSLSVSCLSQVQASSSAHDACTPP